ncbi:MAG: ATP-binding protein [Rectinemataceae bacterium]
MQAPPGSITFFFSDMEGSTVLAQEFPDEWDAIKEWHDAILQSCIEEWNGHVFNIVGDAFCAAFSDIVEATEAAVDVQRRLGVDIHGHRIKVRIGLHTGLAERCGDDYRGYMTLALAHRVMSATHGGQILVSNDHAELLGTGLAEGLNLRDMNENLLKGILKPQRLWQVLAPGLREEFPPLASLSAVPNNLSSQTTGFIGRVREVGQIRDLLEKSRLVTLTGAGGIGKSRIAVQVASEVLTDYPGGVWIIELAPLAEPHLVPQAFCDVLGVAPGRGASAQDMLINYLCPKKILLVVDNCEHLVEACADLIHPLLQACHGLRVIASSRQNLGLSGESIYQVPALSLPGPKSSMEIIRESEAVRLFLERAKAVRPDFEITEANATAIVQICRRLDGLALAIELAASRVRMLKVEQIAAKLNNVFNLLTGGSRSVLPRQQTIHALIDWSYKLLSEEERTVLRRLSVLVGDWTLGDAEAVYTSEDTFELLTRLVDKSLVVVDHDRGEEVRYYLLETIRQYACEQLAEADESSAMRDLHLDYFLGLAERIAPNLYRRDMPRWIASIDAANDNFRSALDWAHERQVTKGLRLCNALFRFWLIRGENRLEGLERMRAFLEASAGSTGRERAWALYHAYVLSGFPRYQNAPENREWRTECISLARESGDLVCEARMLEEFGFHEYADGNVDSARSILEESLSKARTAGDDVAVGYAIYYLGWVAADLSDYAKAQALFEESVGILSRVGELRRWGIALFSIGDISVDQGNWSAARTYYKKALAIAEEEGNRFATSLYLANLGNLELGLGDFRKATETLEMARKLVYGTPDDQFLPYILFYLGEAERLGSSPEAAATWYNEALAIARTSDERIHNLCVLAETERLLGHGLEAKARLQSALSTTYKSHDRWESFLPLAYTAYFAIGQMRAHDAVALLSWIGAWLEDIFFVLPPVYKAEFEEYLGRGRELLSEPEFDSSTGHGKSLCKEEAHELAVRILAEAAPSMAHAAALADC